MAVRDHRWVEGEGPKIQEWLKEVKPSKIDGAACSWIWVQGSPTTLADPEKDTGTQMGALAKAYAILEKLKMRIDEIETDEQIPVRASKGKKSKKAVREEAHNQAKEDLKDLSITSKWTYGKWLFFPSHFNVDKMWTEIATSVAEGPLKEAGVTLAKVAPTPPGDQDLDKMTHVICVYMENIYDLVQVKKVLAVLLSQHGLEPSACKSDLYTLAGIDSNHPTKLRSSIWRPVEIIDGGVDGIKALKAQAEEYRIAKREDVTESPGQKESRVRPSGLIDSDSEDERVVLSAKRNAADVVSAASKSSGQMQPREGQTAPARIPKIAPAPKKRQRTEAEKFKDNDIFAPPSDSD